MDNVGESRSYELAHLVCVARSFWLNYCDREDSCIESTRLICEIGKLLKAKVQPFSVRALALNKPSTQHVQECPTATMQSASMLHNGWSVGIGYPRENGMAPKPNAWESHLIAIWQFEGGSKRYLIDASLDQASRPQKEMDLIPLCLELPDDVPETSVMKIPLELSDHLVIPAMYRGCLIYYESCDLDYRETGAWTRDGWVEDMATEVLESHASLWLSKHGSTGTLGAT